MLCPFHCCVIQLDAVLLANGIQRHTNFQDPDGIDLDDALNNMPLNLNHRTWAHLSSAYAAVAVELTTNYTAVLALIKFFMPHFRARNVSCHEYCFGLLLAKQREDRGQIFFFHSDQLRPGHCSCQSRSSDLQRH